MNKNMYHSTSTVNLCIKDLVYHQVPAWLKYLIQDIEYPLKHHE